MAAIADNTTSVEQFDHAYLKLWFVGSNLSRNFNDVMTIERNGDVIKVWRYNGDVYIVNWNNVTMIEEVNEGDIPRLSAQKD